MSKHEVPVVRISEVLSHPNADKLEIIRVFGYTVCSSKGQFKVGDLAVYIPPDYVLPTDRPEFSFLAKEGETTHRVRISKRRGVISQGFLIPAPETVPKETDGLIIPKCRLACDGELPPIPGDNLINYYGIKRYEAPEPINTNGEVEKAPEGYYPKYDVENFQRYNDIIQEGEPVLITEKLDGSNFRCVFKDGRLRVGSRTEWKSEGGGDAIWWQCIRDNPWIREFCEANPDLAIYGEVFGHQGHGMKYGANGKRLFRAFDLLRGNEWLGWNDIQKYFQEFPALKEAWAPIVYVGPFKLADALEAAEQNTRIPGVKQMSEGVVVRPLVERSDIKIGRVQLKIVGNRYLGS